MTGDNVKTKFRRTLRFHILKPLIGLALAIAGLPLLVIASEQETQQTVTVAVFSMGENSATDKVADLLYTAFTETESIDLLERDEMARIRREKSLSAAMSSPQQRLQLSRTVGADFLVFVEALQQKNKNIGVKLRAVDCRTGCIAYETALTLPQKGNLDKHIKRAAETLRQRMKWLDNISRNEIVPVSVPVLKCLAPEAISDRKIAKRIRRGLRGRLARKSSIICLERKELKKAKREIEVFQGEAAAFWRSSAIITGTVGLQGKDSNTVYASLSLQLPKGEKLELKPGTAETWNVEELLKKLTRRVTTRIISDRDSASDVAYKAGAEIEFLFNQATIYHTKSQFKKAQEMMEAAIALHSGQPTKKQCFRMALILQHVVGGTSLGYPPPEKPAEYFEMMERYIYMFEDFIRPEYSYEKSIIRRDISRFVSNPPKEVKQYRRKHDPEDKAGNAESLTVRRVRRLAYLRKLWRKHNTKWNKIGTRNVITCSRDPDEIIAKYRKHWETVIDQILHPVNENKADGPVYFDESKFRGSKQDGRNPDADQEAERLAFVANHCKRHMWISNETIADSFAYDVSALKDRLKNVHYEILKKLSAKLSLSKKARAVLMFKFAGGPDASSKKDRFAAIEKITKVGAHAHVPVPRRRLVEHRDTILNLLRENLDCKSRHWLIRALLFGADAGKAMGSAAFPKTFWGAWYTLPKKEKLNFYRDCFKPLLTSHPSSPLAAPHDSLRWAHYNLFKREGALSAVEQRILADLFEFHLKQDTNGKLKPNESAYVKTRCQKAKEQYPLIEKKLETDKRRTGATAKKESDNKKLDWPLLISDDLLPESCSFSLSRYDTPRNWILKDEKLWILWGGHGFAITAVDTNTFKAALSSRITLQTDAGDKYRPEPEEDRQFASGTFGFSNKRVFVGVRLRDILETNSSSIIPYATGSLLLADGKGQDAAGGESFASLLRQSIPQPHPAGHKPSPERAAKDITAFCCDKRKIYLANKHGIYCWDEDSNKLSLLASKQIDHESSPLNGGKAYGIYWMGVDPERERILIMLREGDIGTRDTKVQVPIGSRTGLWAYNPADSTWKHIHKMTFGISLPKGLNMQFRNNKIFFNSDTRSGRFDIHRKSWRFRGRFDLYVAKAENKNKWKRSSPLSKMVKSNTGAREARICHPSEEAWIVHQLTGSDTRRAYWVEHGDIVQTVTFTGLNRRTSTWNYDPRAFKLIPAPGGALVWHLRRTNKENLIPALLYWKVQPEKDGEEITYNLGANAK